MCLGSMLNTRARQVPDVTWRKELGAREGGQISNMDSLNIMFEPRPHIQRSDPIKLWSINSYNLQPLNASTLSISFSVHYRECAYSYLVYVYSKDSAAISSGAEAERAELSYVKNKEVARRVITPFLNVSCVLYVGVPTQYLFEAIVCGAINFVLGLEPSDSRMESGEAHLEKHFPRLFTLYLERGL